MKTLNVDLGNRSYPIYIGQQLLTQKALLEPHIASKQVLVVSNDTVAPIYLAGDAGVVRLLFRCTQRWRAIQIVGHA